MGMKSEFINITCLGANVEPLDFKGAREVIIHTEVAALRIYQNQSATGDYFPLPPTIAGQVPPVYTKSTDGYLYLRNDNTGGGANNGTLRAWLVF